MAEYQGIEISNPDFYSNTSLQNYIRKPRIVPGGGFELTNNDAYWTTVLKRITYFDMLIQQAENTGIPRNYPIDHIYKRRMVKEESDG